MSRTGAELIAAERERQIHGEGHLQVDDDRYTEGELSLAAQSYLAAAYNTDKYGTQPPKLWPWSNGWWKPVMNNPVRNLVKSGALFAADRDRLVRAGCADDANDVAKLIDDVANLIDRHLAHAK